MQAIQTQNRLGIFLQVNQMVLSHEFPFDDKEVSCHPIELVVVIEYRHDSIHISVVTSHECLESPPVLFLDHADGKVPIVLLNLLIAFLVY